MKHASKSVAVAALLALVVAGCTARSGQKEQVGTLLGAASGAAIGSRIGGGSGTILAIAAGTLLGALAGNEVGRSLDRSDRLAMASAERKAARAPIGETVKWRNPKSGNHGRVTATREGRSNKGRYCREFQQVVVIGGKEEKAYGTACRQPDGSWEIVNRR